MQTIPKIMPISDMRNHYSQVVKSLPDGPIVLAQHSKPAAVLVSIEQWDETAEELKQLRRLVQMDAALREMEAGDYVTEEEFEQGLNDRGLT